MKASLAGAGSMVLGRSAWGEDAKMSAKAVGFHMPLESEPRREFTQDRREREQKDFFILHFDSSVSHVVFLLFRN